MCPDGNDNRPRFKPLNKLLQIPVIEIMQTRQSPIFTFPPNEFIKAALPILLHKCYCFIRLSLSYVWASTHNRALRKSCRSKPETLRFSVSNFFSILLHLHLQHTHLRIYRQGFFSFLDLCLDVCTVWYVWGLSALQLCSFPFLPVCSLALCAYLDIFILLFLFFLSLLAHTFSVNHSR